MFHFSFYSFVFEGDECLSLPLALLLIYQILLIKTIFFNLRVAGDECSSPLFSPLPELYGIASMLALRNICTVLISSHSFDPRCLASFPTCRINLQNVNKLVI